jgi:hypothetical protein
MGTTDETVSSGLYRVAVLLPHLWPDRPAIWLAQAEAQFQLASITLQRTKFNYVVSLLNQQQAAEVEDFITSPPEQEPFDRLKAEILRRLCTSREQGVRQLSHEEMGDRKPSVSPAPQQPGSRRPGRFSSHHLGQPTPTARASHSCRSDLGRLESASHFSDRICEVTPMPTTASITLRRPTTRLGS